MDKRERIASIVASAVNMALAGVKAPGRLEPVSDATLYYADRILAVEDDSEESEED